MIKHKSLREKFKTQTHVSIGPFSTLDHLHTVPVPTGLKIRSPDSNVASILRYSQQHSVGAMGQQPGVIAIEVNGTRFQVTIGQVADNWYAAFRIARACYMKLRSGVSKVRGKCHVDLHENSAYSAELPLTRYLCKRVEAINFLVRISIYWEYLGIINPTD